MPYLSSPTTWSGAVVPANTLRFVRASNARISRACRDRFRATAAEAQRIEPGVAIDYIPQGQRWRCSWVSNSITDVLHDPARGDLLWVGIAAPPLTGRALFDTKLYVCRQRRRLCL